jgi:hypothetical protein
MAAFVTHSDLTEGGERLECVFGDLNPVANASVAAKGTTERGSALWAAMKLG